MDIAVTQVGAVNTGTDASTIEVASVALVAGRIYVALLYTTFGGSPPSVTSISGTGLSMSKIATTGSAEDSVAAGDARVEAWAGKCTASGTVTISVSLDGTSDNSDVAIYELQNVNNASDLSAFVQAVCLTDEGTPSTSKEITMAGFANTKNRPLAFLMHQRNEVTDHDPGGDGYTELLDAVHTDPSSGFSVQWHDTLDNPDPDWSWATETAFGGIALELAIFPEPPMAALVRSPRRPEKRAPRRRRGLSFAEWFPFPPAQSLGVVSFAQWSREVELVEGDEIRVTLSGPAADQPQVRISLGFKQVH